MGQNSLTPGVHSDFQNDHMSVAPTSHAYATVVDGKAIVLNLDSGRYYSLNRTGTTLWEELSGGCSLPILLNSLSTRGGISQEKANQDLSTFLDNLKSEGLIEQTRRA